MPYPRKTQCKAGHPWTEENTLWHMTKGRKPIRRCKACLQDENKSRVTYMRDYQRARRERQAIRPRPERCEVCGNPPAATEQGKVLCWDHDHGSGSFRGWLCNSCNVILGRAGDNPRILRKLADYLDTGPRTVSRVVFG